MLRVLSRNKLTKPAGGQKKVTFNTGKYTTLSCCPAWQTNKTTNIINHPEKGFSMVWCPHHKSKDGSVNVMYMPAPHNYEEW